MKKIIRECLRIAQSKNTPDLHPEWDTYKHYSFIIQGGKILEYGFNRPGTPFIHGYRHEFSKIHSETDAFKKAKGILDFSKPFDVINIRLNKRGEIRNSHPCPCCFNFLKSIGARKVYYSTNIGFGRIVY